MANPRYDSPTKICPSCQRIIHESERICDCGYEFPSKIAAAGLDGAILAFRRLDDSFAEIHARYIDARAREEIEHGRAGFSRPACPRPRRDIRRDPSL